MIEVRNLCKSFGGAQVVHDVSFMVEKGETLILIGLSGCGKTTTLKMTNRLVEPDSGEILINGTNVVERSPFALRRNVGYVIQDIGLLPHFTVGRNVGLVPRLQGWDKQRVAEQTHRMLELVGLEPGDYAERYPRELSGGQKQRVGVARALAGEPEILLMDEPFGALDPITREDLQDEFLKLQETLRKTIVFVTHDIFEAVKMGDRIAVMNNGKIEQIDYPEVILSKPAGPFIERFVGQHKEYLTEYAYRRAKERKS